MTRQERPNGGDSQTTINSGVQSTPIYYFTNQRMAPALCMMDTKFRLDDGTMHPSVCHDKAAAVLQVKVNQRVMVVDPRLRIRVTQKRAKL